MAGLLDMKKEQRSQPKSFTVVVKNNRLINYIECQTLERAKQEIKDHPGSYLLQDKTINHGTSN